MFRIALISMLLTTGSLTYAGIVEVTYTGIVEWNQINPAPLGNVNVGDQAVLSFQVDSKKFLNSSSFPTRGYIIEPSSWSLMMGSTTIEIQSPFNGTPYFVLRDNDPVVDGLMLSTNNVDLPFGVQLDQFGAFGPFTIFAEVTYNSNTLSSLDILDAVGTYNFKGLNVYNFLVGDGPYQPLGIVFEELTIADKSTYCPDINGDGYVNVTDLLVVIDQWGLTDSPADLNFDGIVDVSDLLIVVGSWGPCE